MIMLQNCVVYNCQLSFQLNWKRFFSTSYIAVGWNLADISIWCQRNFDLLCNSQPPEKPPFRFN